MTTALRRLPTACALAILGVLAGCIDNTVDPELVEIDFLVGRWDAREMQMISQEDPDRVVDLMEVFGASFTLEVEASGRYVAELSLGGGSPLPEEGSLSVEGDSLVFRADVGTESRAHFQLENDGSILILDGPNEFDFDRDLETEPATLHLELHFF